MQENDPDILVDLTTEASAFQAEVTRAALESAGFPAFATTTAGTGLAWELAGVMPMRVQVRRRELEAARAELLAIRRDAASIDWANEDLGDPEQDEPSARATSAPNWLDRFTQRRSLGQLLICFACASMYAKAVFIALIVALFELIGGMTYG